MSARWGFDPDRVFPNGERPALAHDWGYGHEEDNLPPLTRVCQDASEVYEEETSKRKREEDGNAVIRHATPVQTQTAPVQIPFQYRGPKPRLPLRSAFEEGPAGEKLYQASVVEAFDIVNETWPRIVFMRSVGGPIIVMDSFQAAHCIQPHRIGDAIHSWGAFKIENRCLACPQRLEKDNDKIRRVFPCGHTMCGDCFDSLHAGQRSIFCNYCRSCVIRHFIRPDGIVCGHPVRYLEIRGHKSVEIPRGFFLGGGRRRYVEPG